MPPTPWDAPRIAALHLWESGLAATLALLFVYALGLAQPHNGACLGHGRGAIECYATAGAPAEACEGFGRGGRRCPSQPL
jgi:hypothetical protein